MIKQAQLPSRKQMKEENTKRTWYFTTQKNFKNMVFHNFDVKKTLKSRNTTLKLKKRGISQLCWLYGCVKQGVQ